MGFAPLNIEFAERIGGIILLFEPIYELGDIFEPDIMFEPGDIIIFEPGGTFERGVIFELDIILDPEARLEPGSILGPIILPPSGIFEPDDIPDDIMLDPLEPDIILGPGGMFDRGIILEPGIIFELDIILERGDKIFDPDDIILAPGIIFAPDEPDIILEGGIKLFDPGVILEPGIIPEPGIIMFAFELLPEYVEGESSVPREPIHPSLFISPFAACTIDNGSCGTILASGTIPGYLRDNPSICRSYLLPSSTGTRCIACLLLHTLALVNASIP